MAHQVLQLLKDLNSKERFFLVGQVLGNQGYVLCREFRSALGTAIGIEIPEDAFCAMDYHLDWIHAAVCQDAEGCGTKGVQGSQQDVDLLVAFEQSGLVHLVLIEAKATTGWTVGQQEQKAKRLVETFGENGAKRPGIQPHYVLMSPRQSAALTKKSRAAGAWPEWFWKKTDKNPQGEVCWLELVVPKALKKVTRCNQTTGKPEAGSEFWKIEARRGARL